MLGKHRKQKKFGYYDGIMLFKRELPWANYDWADLTDAERRRYAEREALTQG